jgi:hypothetical protein
VTGATCGQGPHEPGAGTRSGLVTRLAQVGDVASANVPAARIGGDHRWATAGYRLSRYSKECGYFSYLNKTVQPI